MYSFMGQDTARGGDIAQQARVYYTMHGAPWHSTMDGAIRYYNPGGYWAQWFEETLDPRTGLVTMARALDSKLAPWEGMQSPGNIPGTNVPQLPPALTPEAGMPQTRYWVSVADAGGLVYDDGRPAYTGARTQGQINGNWFIVEPMQGVVSVAQGSGTVTPFAAPEVFAYESFEAVKAVDSVNSLNVVNEAIQGGLNADAYNQAQAGSSAVTAQTAVGQVAEIGAGGQMGIAAGAKIGPASGAEAPLTYKDTGGLAIEDIGTLLGIDTSRELEFFEAGGAGYDMMGTPTAGEGNVGVTRAIPESGLPLPQYDQPQNIMPSYVGAGGPGVYGLDYGGGAAPREQAGVAVDEFGREDAYGGLIPEKFVDRDFGRDAVTGALPETMGPLPATSAGMPSWIWLAAIAGGLFLLSRR